MRMTAEQAREQVEVRNHKRPWGGPWRLYRCSLCRSVHVTSQPRVQMSAADVELNGGIVAVIQAPTHDDHSPRPAGARRGKRRMMEGALSAERTPTRPPAVPRLAPLAWPVLEPMRMGFCCGLCDAIGVVEVGPGEVGVVAHAAHRAISPRCEGHPRPADVALVEMWTGRRLIALAWAGPGPVRRLGDLRLLADAR
jgi:hypothetical protein